LKKLFPSFLYRKSNGLGKLLDIMNFTDDPFLYIL
jgi:hypothetical protein